MSIANRVFWGFVLFSVIAQVGLLAWLESSDLQLFRAYREVSQRERLEPLARGLELDYASHHQWTHLSQAGLWERFVSAVPEGPQLTLLDAQQRRVVGSSAGELSSAIRRPLHSGPEVVGYLACDPALLEVGWKPPGWGRWVGLLLAGLAWSALGAVWLARQVRQPLRPLVQGLEELASGHYQGRIAVQGQDEVARLAVGLNHLASTLQRGEESRKQWVADVSHEFRTPLAVLRAELEALQDGVRKPEPQALDLLHGQVMALTHLTEDLFQLARSDLGQMHYRMRELDLPGLVQEVATPFVARYQKAGLVLEVAQPSGRLGSPVWGDGDRLRQLLSNLLENSLRYTRSPGRVEIRCLAQAGEWLVQLDDSAPGVAPELFEKLFDRFFRVESSRSKTLGGAGLGLPLCRNIAQAHQGSLVAGPSPLGGVRMELRLPMYPR